MSYEVDFETQMDHTLRSKVRSKILVLAIETFEDLLFEIPMKKSIPIKKIA